VVHCWGKEWKHRPRNGSNECVYGYRAVGVEAIAVNHVVHALPEGNQAAHADKSGGQNLGYPRDVGI